MELPLKLRNVAGAVGGVALAPWTGLVSLARRGRMFHPTGRVFSAEVRQIAGNPEARDIAARLAGPALVRLSSAWWKRAEWPDVLGCAVRFTELPLQAHARQGDQDLLFATILRPWTMLFAPLTTRFRDFLANDYYAVSPFEVDGLGRVEWRLRPIAASPSGNSRSQRLLEAVESGRARMVLEYARYRSPLAVRDDSGFVPVAEIELSEPAALDQDELRFDAFRADRGIHPVGFVQWLRRATYASSRRQPSRRSAQPGSDKDGARRDALLGGAGAVVATLGVGVGLRQRR